jgi:hypothetical protein
MTTLQRADVAQLIGLGVDAVKNWLLIGLDTWRHGSDELEPRSTLAFPGAEHVILGDGDITDALAAIDTALDEGSRIDLAKGCAAALASLRLDEIPRHTAVAEDLIRLGTKLGTRDLLPVLADIALVTGPRAPERMRLLHFALRHFAAAGSSSPRLQDAAQLRRMIANYKQIPPRHAVPALFALLKVAPRRLTAHLNLLAKPLEAEFGLRPDEPDADAEERAQRRANLIMAVARDEATYGALRSSYRVGSLRHADGGHGHYENYHWWTLTLRIGRSEQLVALRKTLGLAKREGVSPNPEPAASTSLVKPNTMVVFDSAREHRLAIAGPLLDAHLPTYSDAELEAVP